MQRLQHLVGVSGGVLRLGQTYDKDWTKIVLEAMLCAMRNVLSDTILCQLK